MKNPFFKNISYFDTIEIEMNNNYFKGTVMNFTEVNAGTFDSSISYLGVTLLSSKRILEFRHYKNIDMTCFKMNITRIVLFEKRYDILSNYKKRKMLNSRDMVYDK